MSPSDYRKELAHLVCSLATIVALARFVLLLRLAAAAGFPGIWLAKDPDPDAAWPRFLDQMLRSEDTRPGLLMVQQYLGRLPKLGEQVAAVKLMLRCRLHDHAFRPLSPDPQGTIEAALVCGNAGLATSLSG